MEKVATIFDVLLKNVVKLLVRMFPNIHPNYYTIARLILTIPTVICLIIDQTSLALILFIFSALLDLLDGPIARYKKMTSRTGAFLDPFADKILFLSVIVLYYDFVFSVFFFALVIIELLLMGEHILKYIYLKKQDLDTRKEKQKSPLWGKIKFWFEMIGVGLLIINYVDPIIIPIANSILLIGLIFAVLSFATHLKVYLPEY